jgi:hypothetical protein
VDLYDICKEMYHITQPDVQMAPKGAHTGDPLSKEPMFRTIHSRLIRACRWRQLRDALGWSAVIVGDESCIPLEWFNENKKSETQWNKAIDILKQLLGEQITDQLTAALGEQGSAGLQKWVATPDFTSWFNALGDPSMVQPSDDTLRAVLLVASKVYLSVQNTLGLPDTPVACRVLASLESSPVTWPEFGIEMLARHIVIGEMIVAHLPEGSTVSPLRSASIESMVNEIIPWCSFPRVLKRRCLNCGRKWESPSRTFTSVEAPVDLAQGLDDLVDCSKSDDSGSESDGSADTSESHGSADSCKSMLVVLYLEFGELITSGIVRINVTRSWYLSDVQEKHALP